MTDTAKTRHKDGHVHLAVVQSAPAAASEPKASAAKPAWDWARGPVLGAGADSVALFVASVFAPWW